MICSNILVISLPFQFWVLWLFSLCLRLRLQEINVAKWKDDVHNHDNGKISPLTGPTQTCLTDSPLFCKSRMAATLSLSLSNSYCLPCHAFLSEISRDEQSFVLDSVWNSLLLFCRYLPPLWFISHLVIIVSRRHKRRSREKYFCREIRDFFQNCGRALNGLGALPKREFVPGQLPGYPPFCQTQRSRFGKRGRKYHRYLSQSRTTQILSFF